MGRLGANGLVLMTHPGTRDVYPFFSGSDSGTFSPLIEVDSTILGRRHALRGYVKLSTAQRRTD